MFNMLLPYGLIDPDNPVFQQERQHIRWLRTPKRLREYNQLAFVGLPVIIGLWWLLERANLNFGYYRPDFETRLINLVLFISLGLMLLSSLFSIPEIIGPLHRQFNSGYWDTLRLTSQFPSAILMAEDAVSQLRIWPFIALEAGLRIAIVGIFLASNSYNLYQSSADKALYVQFTLYNPICWAGNALFLLIGIAFIIEPILRSRVIVAFSTAIALRVESLPLAFLAGFGVILCIHLIQAALIASIGYMIQSIANESGAGIAIVFCVIPLSLIAIGIFYLIYTVSRRKALAFTLRNAFPF